MRRTLGASHAGQACAKTAARSSTPRAIGERGNSRPALERGADADGQHRMDAQLRAHVLGEENSRVEPVCRRKPTASPSISTTSTNSMAATPTVMRVSHGPSSANLTGPGSSARSSARFATCQARARAASSTARNIFSRTWSRLAGGRFCGLDHGGPPPPRIFRIMDP